jgi:hypothetical protein
MSVKPIAVVKPGILDISARQVLITAGYAVVESDDQDCVRLVQGVVLPINEALTFHAMAFAIANTRAHESVQTVFGRELARLLTSSGEPPK